MMNNDKSYNITLSPVNWFIAYIIVFMNQSRKSKGWFTCDKKCQTNKIDYEIALREYNFQRSEEERIIADAKSSVGIFSSFGVEETRGLFWTRFASGKEFAQRQTKYDALFQGSVVIAGSFVTDMTQVYFYIL